MAKAKEKPTTDEKEKIKTKKTAKSAPTDIKKTQKKEGKNKQKPAKNSKKIEKEEKNKKKQNNTPPIKQEENAEILQPETTKKVKPKKIKKERPPVYETVEEIKPILHSTASETDQTMYFDSTTGKPLYGPMPVNFDPVTKKPVFVANQSGVKVVQTQVQVTHKNQKLGFSVASTACILAGLLFFSICYFVVSLSANTEYGIFWGITILSWLFGPIMIMIVPPLCYAAGLVFMFISFFKSPSRIYTWVCIPINLTLLAGGIYLLATYIPNIL